MTAALEDEIIREMARLNTPRRSGDAPYPECLRGIARRVIEVVRAHTDVLLEQNPEPR